MNRNALWVALMCLGGLSAANAEPVMTTRAVSFASSDADLSALAVGDADTLYSTLNDVPGRIYSPGIGTTIAAVQPMVASAFKLDGDASIHALRIAVNKMEGTADADVTVTLRDTEGKHMGAPLYEWHAKLVGPSIPCCEMLLLQADAGIRVVGGKTYWIEVVADDPQVTEAAWFKSKSRKEFRNQWMAYFSTFNGEVGYDKTVANAFAVYGKFDVK